MMSDQKELKVHNSDLDYLVMMIIWILCLVELFEIQIAIVVSVQAAVRFTNKRANVGLDCNRKSLLQDCDAD